MGRGKFLLRRKHVAGPMTITGENMPRNRSRAHNAPPLRVSVAANVPGVVYRATCAYKEGGGSVIITFRFYRRD